MAAMVLAAVTLGHELIYLLAHGPGEGYVRAMTEGGHDRYWTTFLLTVTAVVGGLFLAVMTQLLRLRRLAAAAREGSVDVGDSAPTRLLAIAGGLWIRLMLVVVALYVLQENIETAAVGGGLPFHQVLLGEHAIAVPVLAVSSLFVAFVAGLFAWRRDVYLARLRAATRPPRTSGANPRRPATWLGRPATFASGRRNGVRAPPIGMPEPA